MLLKTKPLILSAVAALALASAISVRAQVTLPDIAEATVRAGANANVDINEVTVGFQRVKFVADGSPGNTTACAKSYFKFDFTGQNPNTNADLTLSLTGAANSQISTMRVWSLNQAYPAFTNNVLVWNTAQANDTNMDAQFQGTFQLLTNGPFTATPVASFRAAGTTTVKIPAPWGNLIISNQMVLVIAGTNDPALAGNNGYRMALNTTALIFPALIGRPPSISLIPNLTVTADQTSATNNFTLADPDGNPINLAPTAISSDETIVPSASVFFLGSGANRQVYLIAGGNPGTATVEVSVADEKGDMAQRTFTVTVLPQIFPPTISTPANTNTLVNTPVTVPFTIGDLSAPVASLTVTATVDANSGNELASTVLGGSGTNRTVTVTPVKGADGVGIVGLSISDATGNTMNTSFAVMVLSNRTVFSDHFDYPDGQLFTVSDQLWMRRGNVQFATLSTVSQAVSLLPGTVQDDGYATLVGAPYATGNRSLIYITFTANWSAAPTVDSGSFVSLANSRITSAAQVCAIGFTTNDVGDGSFNLKIANGNGFTKHPLDLMVGTPYKIAARYDVDSAIATLWINAASESDPSSTNVTATDVGAPVSVSTINLKQNLNSGSLTVDDLKVSVVTRPQINTVRVVGSNVQIDFAASADDATSDFGVISSANLTLPLSDVSATITSLGAGAFRATLPVPGRQGFYRLKRQPFSF